ncbi:MAG: hypothetical protein L6Q98_22375 [Anaerolineae bacterium]|nr:hypothetical protein [Anaerolineae bacterium]NUQ06621.1 hypothetical protein [Anaerolineae bacterium]
MSDRREPTAEITRQPWQTPTLVNLSARRTESGNPYIVEDTYTNGSLIYFYGPVATEPGS